MLDAFQHEVRAHIGDAGQAEQEAFEKSIIRIEVRAQYPQMIVGLTGGGEAVEHFGSPLNFSYECVDMSVVVTRQRDMHDRVEFQS